MKVTSKDALYVFVIIDGKLVAKRVLSFPAPTDLDSLRVVLHVLWSYVAALVESAVCEETYYRVGRIAVDVMFSSNRKEDIEKAERKNIVDMIGVLPKLMHAFPNAYFCARIKEGRD